MVEKFSEIVKENTNLGKLMNQPFFNLTILSNIVVQPVGPIIEYYLRSEGVNAICTFGNYDNILQDAANLNNTKACVVFWDIANLIDGFQYRSILFDESQTQEYIRRFTSEIDLFFKNVEAVPVVLFNKFSTLPFNHHYFNKNVFDEICDALNVHVNSVLPSNVQIIDIEKVYSKVGIVKSVDFRNYYSSKALYTVEFFKQYAEFVKPIFLAINGKAKKVLVFDCDNTLWHGILGEDGIEGIDMSSASSKGVVYNEVQTLAKSLVQQGVIIAVNSKNNSQDVDDVFSDHPDVTIKSEDIVVKKVNWNNKLSNLKDIANELNIGIDSLVFFDDADFEIQLISQYLPEVKSIQVPELRYLYPSVFRKAMPLFYSRSQTPEDRLRAKLYKDQFQREAGKHRFENLDDYLQALEIKIVVRINDESLVPRMAQLTQKTNQFNLTTKRYTESEISNFLQSGENLVIALDVMDKYGDFGTTGLAIVNLNGFTAEIDTLLLSCRVIGRKIEFKFLDEIMQILASKNVNIVKAEFISTVKNEQVRELYKSCGFELVDSDQKIASFKILLEAYQQHKLNYISVIYG